jgi:hypothetical protein
MACAGDTPWEGRGRRSIYAGLRTRRVLPRQTTPPSAAHCAAVAMSLACGISAGEGPAARLWVLPSMNPSFVPSIVPSPIPHAFPETGYSLWEEMRTHPTGFVKTSVVLHVKGCKISRCHAVPRRFRRRGMQALRAACGLSLASGGHALGRARPRRIGSMSGRSVSTPRTVRRPSLEAVRAYAAKRSTALA